LNIGELRTYVVSSSLECSLSCTERLLKLVVALGRDVASLHELCRILKLGSSVFHLSHRLTNRRRRLRANTDLIRIQSDAGESLAQRCSSPLQLQGCIGLVELGQDLSLANALTEVSINSGDSARDLEAHIDGLVRLQ
jgi:hypothetical protein